MALPSALSSQLTAMNIGAVIGTNLISRGVLTIDFERQCVAFDPVTIKEIYTLVYVIDILSCTYIMT